LPKYVNGFYEIRMKNYGSLGYVTSANSYLEKSQTYYSKSSEMGQHECRLFK
jgi:hypothetical protein